MSLRFSFGRLPGVRAAMIAGLLAVAAVGRGLGDTLYPPWPCGGYCAPPQTAGGGWIHCDGDCFPVGPYMLTDAYVDGIGSAQADQWAWNYAHWTCSAPASARYTIAFNYDWDIFGCWAGNTPGFPGPQGEGDMLLYLRFCVLDSYDPQNPFQAIEYAPAERRYDRLVWVEYSTPSSPPQKSS